MKTIGYLGLIITLIYPLYNYYKFIYNNVQSENTIEYLIINNNIIDNQFDFEKTQQTLNKFIINNKSKNTNDVWVHP